MEEKFEEKNNLNPNKQEQLDPKISPLDTNIIKKIGPYICIKFIIVKLIMKMDFYAKFHILVEILIFMFSLPVIKYIKLN